MPKTRIFIACSLNGYIAGPGDDLSFLSDPRLAPGPDDAPSEALSFEAFMEQVGAMVMGRRTHDVVKSFGVWPYGETPVLVATRRPLEPAAATVRAVEGEIGELIAQAKALAGDRDLYIDGGDVIAQALNAGLVDEVCIAIVPTLLPDGGVRLFDGLLNRSDFTFDAPQTLGGMVQLTARPIR